MTLSPFIPGWGAHSVVKTSFTSKDNSVFECNTFHRICHRNFCGIGSIYYQLTQTHDFAGGSLQKIPANICKSTLTESPTKKNIWVFDFNFQWSSKSLKSGSCRGFFVPKKLLRFPPTSARAHSPGCGIWKAGGEKQDEGCRLEDDSSEKDLVKNFIRDV